MRRLVDRNPLTGESVWYEFNHSDHSATITHEQDVESVLERNIAAANDDDKTKRGIKNDLWKYASIPNIVQIEWKQKFGVDIMNRDHQKAMFKLLNSPEYAYLKCTTKHHAG
jgi:hypothetical protein